MTALEDFTLVGSLLPLWLVVALGGLLLPLLARCCPCGPRFEPKVGMHSLIAALRRVYVCVCSQVLLRPDGLSLSSELAGGVTYSRRLEEAPPAGTVSAPPQGIGASIAANGGGGGGGSGGGGGGGGGCGGGGGSSSGSGVGVGGATPWPPLFLTPQTASSETLLSVLWPSVLTLMEKRPPPYAHVAVHGSPTPVEQLDGAEYTLCLQHMDERVLVLLAFPGKKGMKPNDAPAALLRTLSDGLSCDKLAEGSLRSKHAPTLSWWSALLGGIKSA